MDVMSVDVYNMSAVIGGVSKTLNNIATDSDHIPVVCFQLCGDRDNPSVSTSEKAYCIPANPMSDRGQAVVYSVDALSSNSMKSSNPHSGFHETNISKCLDTSCCEPSCNQGGVIVVVNNCS